VVAVKAVLDQCAFHQWSPHLPATLVVNSVLINRYLSGRDSMGYHEDAYWAMGPQPYILSVSLGVARKFRLRNKKTRQIITSTLEHGSVLLMYGRKVQEKWEHNMDKDTTQELRLNLSFRYHVRKDLVQRMELYHKRTGVPQNQIYKYFL